MGVRIHALRCGWTGVPPLLAARAGLRLPAGEGGRVWLPAFCYLIEHPRGPLLVDTGWPREISPAGVYDRAAQRRLLPAKLRPFCHGRAAPGETAAEQLAALGLAPRDLRCVLLSHLDADCAAGLASLAGAERFLVSEEERFWTARVNPRYARALWQDTPLEIFWFRGSMDGAYLGRAHDLFGDGSVRLVNLLGHSFGMFATVVRDGGRFAVLGADGALDLDAPPTGDASQRRALAWLRAQREQPGCAGVLLRHDPAGQPRVLAL